MDAMGPIPYSALNTMLDPAFPKGALNYWKAQFITDLSDDAIRTMAAAFQECPSPDGPDRHRTFSRSGEPRSRVRTACAMRVTGLQRRDHLAVGRVPRKRSEMAWARKPTRR